MTDDLDFSFCYATHKTPAVKRWLKAHLRFTPTPVSCSASASSLRSPASASTAASLKVSLSCRVSSWNTCKNHNADPKPFIRTKSGDEILKKVARAKQALKSQRQAIAFAL